jgi:hypothetical protein
VLVVHGGVAGGGDVVGCVAPLLAERRHDREDVRMRETKVLDTSFS